MTWGCTIESKSSLAHVLFFSLTQLHLSRIEHRLPTYNSAALEQDVTSRLNPDFLQTTQLHLSRIEYRLLAYNSATLEQD